MSIRTTKPARLQAGALSAFQQAASDLLEASRLFTEQSVDKNLLADDLHDQADAARLEADHLIQQSADAREQATALTSLLKL